MHSFIQNGKGIAPGELLPGRASTLAAHGQGAMAALNDGYHLAFWIAASLVAAAIAVAGTVLRSGD